MTTTTTTTTTETTTRTKDNEQNLIRKTHFGSGELKIIRTCLLCLGFFNVSLENFTLMWSGHKYNVHITGRSYLRFTEHRIVR